MVAACSGTDEWRAEAAAEIGDELAGRLAEPLAQAANTTHDIDSNPVMSALKTAVDDMVLPSGVNRIVPGSPSSTGGEGGYADVSLTLVVVPVDTPAMFCMVFAVSNTGELVAEPASGDPVDRCDDTRKVRLAGP